MVHEKDKEETGEYYKLNKVNVTLRKSYFLYITIISIIPNTIVSMNNHFNYISLPFSSRFRSCESEGFDVLPLFLEAAALDIKEIIFIPNG
jgi:hypothetical protein